MHHTPPCSPFENTTPPPARPQDDEARFRDVRPLQLTCSACGDSANARPLSAGLAGPDGRHPALACALCGDDYAGLSIYNALTLAMREAERRYYTSPLLCEEGSCREVSRCLSVFVSTDENGQPLFPVRAAAEICGGGGTQPQGTQARAGARGMTACPAERSRLPRCLCATSRRTRPPARPSSAQACVAPRCRSRMGPEHSARELHTQLLYLERLYDAAYAQRRAERAHRRKPTEHGPWVRLSDRDARLCDALRAHVRTRLSACAFDAVNLAQLCSLVRGVAPAPAGAVGVAA
jgi:hypothetical protein